MRVYIIGLMTGIQDDKREAFFKKINKLKEKGHTPVYTADVPDNWEPEEYLVESFKRLKTCDAYVKIDGWKNSNGMMREMEVAKKHGIPEYKDSVIAFHTPNIASYNFLMKFLTDTGFRWFTDHKPEELYVYHINNENTYIYVNLPTSTLTYGKKPFSDEINQIIEINVLNKGADNES